MEQGESQSPELEQLLLRPGVFATLEQCLGSYSERELRVLFKTDEYYKAPYVEREGFAKIVGAAITQGEWDALVAFGEIT